MSIFLRATARGAIGAGQAGAFLDHASLRVILSSTAENSGVQEDLFEVAFAQPSELECARLNLKIRSLRS